MNTKQCVGCFQQVTVPELEPEVEEVESDDNNNADALTICDECKVPLSHVPDEISRQHRCGHCGGETNLIGAFRYHENVSPGKQIFLYFNCLNNCPLQSINLFGIVLELKASARKQNFARGDRRN